MKFLTLQSRSIEDVAKDAATVRMLSKNLLRPGQIYYDVGQDGNIRKAVKCLSQIEELAMNLEFDLATSSDVGSIVYAIGPTDANDDG